MASQVGIPRGTRDFSPQEVARREYLFGVLRKHFYRYGYLPIETPAMENLETLLGKYGDEGDKLIFRTLNSGPFFEEFKKELSKSTAHISQLLMSLFRDFSKDIIDTNTHTSVNVNDTIRIFKDKYPSYINKYNTYIKDDSDSIESFICKNSVPLALMLLGDVIEPVLINIQDKSQFEFCLDRFQRSQLNELILPAYWFENTTSTKLSQDISEKALRYDLTVPFARYVVQHRNEITIPFKRFQIQPVWRADKPQKGRYREFYQCDADVIGSTSLNNEIELIHLTDDVFRELGIPVLIKVNNRKILSGIAEVCGAPEKITDITVAIDKLDKTSVDAVIAELKTKGISDSGIEKIKPLFAVKGTAAEKIAFLKTYLKDSQIGLIGVNELEHVVLAVEKEGLKNSTVEPDITLARGLNYYTGAIFEVKALTGELKVSICGGGRYDDLTGIFGWKDMSGVGISFGADRIYDIMNELNLFPASAHVGTQVLIINFGNEEETFSRGLLSKLREKGLRVEFFPDPTKMAKQMKYANDRKIPFVVLIGSNERQNGMCQVKTMDSGEQLNVSLENLGDFLLDKLK